MGRKNEIQKMKIKISLKLCFHQSYKINQEGENHIAIFCFIPSLRDL